MNAVNGSILGFDGVLVLGDPGTGTGTLNVDASSTLIGFGTAGGVAPFTAGQLANLVNAGTIDLTRTGGIPADSFTVSGNYMAGTDCCCCKRSSPPTARRPTGSS